MRYIFGVDGGGTKTEIVVCTENGNLVGWKIGGSSNPVDIGNDKMVEVICGLINDVLPNDCDDADIGLGISGIFTAGSEDFLREKLKSAFPVLNRIKAYSDKDSSINCAYDGDGCIVIIGTGSVGAVCKNGIVKDIGGGGYLVDCGISGFDLGKEVLNAALSVEDGRIKNSVIYDLFCDKVKESVRAHLKTVYNKGKSYVASFAPIVFSALESGDAVAEQILRKCSAEFEKILYAVYNEWGMDSCEVTVFGGLVKQFSVIERFLSLDIKSKIVFKMPKYPIIYGLIKNFSVQKNFAETFYGDYKKGGNAE